ncbi:nuclear transport factor 2 family protein [Kribbella sp. CA-293567]|uniref:nuclear transport factor 2 family protein n=1 Tax=Kribbella sp. CA-293567 TaxID=3002436 RepID=UPI0022DE76F4|nr:nuclear transport factor 2 family protein [Kribbella sp. CA-293567]WBQ04392.1 nuclear transport factor 2 family protein [Kribbella sp. CA-293567]
MKKNLITAVLTVSVATAGVATVAAVGPANAQVPAPASSAPASASTVSAAASWGHHNSKAIVSQWETAWTKNQPAKMAALFTRDSTYTDLAFGAEWHGQAEIGNWVTKTHAVIKNTKVKVHTSFRSGNQIAIEWTFSGTMPGATKPFAVPATTIIKLRGEKIVTNSDYYNLAVLLKQSGLPANWPEAS